MTKIKNKESLVLGVISDTHGLLLPEAVNALRDVDLIIHAGDIGSQKVLEKLCKIAPVVAVRGNMDSGKWGRSLPETEMIDLGPMMLYILHDLNGLDLDPSASGIRVVISGHTHSSSAVEHGDVFYLNPGSAAYPRYRTPATLALVKVQGRSLDTQFITLNK